MMEKEKMKELSITLINLRDIFLKLGLYDLRVKIDNDGTVTYWNEHFESEEQKIDGGVYPYETLNDVERW